ncbi:MAG: ABC transporter permease subunit [Candidatus Aminicenantes bacterium]|nr:ABC transporter permease subunit [Candidatus Aminicenantes bacterium]
MSIKEKGYTHWDGELESRRFPWSPIMRSGIRLTFKKKFFKLFFFLNLIPAVVYLAGIYISERLEDFEFMIREASMPFKVNPAYFNSFLSGDYLLFMIVMILVFAGAGLIADDLKHNSLQLYFSRPLKKRDYFMGKTSIVFFFLLIVTLVPGLVLFLMKLIFAGNFKFIQDYPWLPLSIIGYSVLLTAFFACYALFLSALSRNSRYVAVMTFGMYLFSDILYSIFNGIFRKPAFALMSIKANLQQIGAAFFGVKLPYDVPWMYSFVLLVLFCGVAVIFLSRRVRGVEVVR